MAAPSSLQLPLVNSLLGPNWRAAQRINDVLSKNILLFDTLYPFSLATTRTINVKNNSPLVHVGNDSEI